MVAPFGTGVAQADEEFVRLQELSRGKMGTGVSVPQACGR